MELVYRDVPGPKRDLVGYGPNPPRVVWPGGAALALNLVVNYEEGSEYSLPAGDGRNEGLAEINYTMSPEHRDLAAESVYEYGSRAGIWRLMRLFDEYGVKTTFFACAVALDRNPEVGQWLQEAGHEPCSHGWRWSEHWLYSREEEAEKLRWAIEVIERTCGERPLGWYCRYGPSVNTRELVVEEGGFLYDSDAYNDDLPYWTMVGGRKHLVIPYSLVNNDSRFSQGHFGPPEDFEEHLRYTFDRLYKEGATRPKMMSIGLHMRVAGHPGRAAAVARFIAYAKSHSDVWFARRIEIARHWQEHHP